MAAPSSPAHASQVQSAVNSRRRIDPAALPSLLAEAGAAGEGTRAPDSSRPFVTDLNLDQVVAAVAGDREEKDFISRAMVRPLRDPAAVQYRQQIFRDLENPALFGEIRRFSEAFGQVRSHLRQLPKMDYRYQREGWLLDAVALYCQAVRGLSEFLASAEISAQGLQDLRGYLAGYVASAPFSELARETEECKAGLAQIRFGTRIQGGRVEVTRYEGEPDYSAEVLKVFDRFAQGAVKDYRLRFRTEPGMNHITAQITDFVARLFPDEFTALDQYCERHAGFADENIRRADTELQFYLAYLDYIRPLRSAELRFCYPGVSAAPEAVCAEDTFDLALAGKLVFERKPVVTNDFRLEGAERILVVTGPNQGGKTTFARTFGQLHHLASLGCPVPGSRADLLLPDRIFTHFAREEDITQLSGKLEDDLARIGEILRSATSASVVILNEVFASTTVHDARFLGTKLLRKIMELGARCVYVTFVDELASLADPVVSMMSTIVPENPAERTYKVVRKPADGLAYALAIAEKHHVTYEQLRKRLA